MVKLRVKCERFAKSKYVVFTKCRPKGVIISVLYTVVVKWQQQTL